MTKIATDIEQSKILAEILPIESADMSYHYFVPDLLSDGYCVSIDKVEDETDIPCWSLAALLDAMPPIQELCSSTDHYYRIHCMNLFSEWHENAIDSCVEMIIKLHEKGLL